MDRTTTNNGHIHHGIEMLRCAHLFSLRTSATTPNVQTERRTAAIQILFVAMA